jgi:hypothetical protein
MLAGPEYDTVVYLHGVAGPLIEQVGFGLTVTVLLQEVAGQLPGPVVLTVSVKLVAPSEATLTDWLLAEPTIVAGAVTDQP